MGRRIMSDDILKLFEEKSLNSEESQYLCYHSERLAYTTTLVQHFIDRFHARRILDVGPHFLTYCFINLLEPPPIISTLGFANERLFPADLTERHFSVDLNECESANVASSGAAYDLITFSETIEHLYTSPTVILSFLSKFLKNERGTGILIQTPNAASFSKRMQLLCGRNPYELIRSDRTNPGHLREYTMKELERFASVAGFRIWHKEYCGYWSGDSLTKKVFGVYPPFRDGIVMILVRE